MALTRFGFIVTGSNLDPEQHVMTMRSREFEMLAVGVTAPEQAVPVAKKMVRDGIELIELCGGFGPVWTARIIEAIDRAVPVGSVAYGPESIDQMYALFAPSPA